MDMVATIDFKLAVLAALIDTGAPLDAVKLHLGSADIVPAPDTPLASYVECTFDGYAALSPVVWTDPYINPDGEPVVSSGSHLFLCTGDTVTETAFTWYVTDTAGTGLLLAGRLPQSKTFSVNGDGLDLIIDYGYGSGA